MLLPAPRMRTRRWRWLMNCRATSRSFAKAFARIVNCRYGWLNSIVPPGEPPALHGIMRVRAFTQDDAHIFSGIADRS